MLVGVRLFRVSVLVLVLAWVLLLGRLLDRRARGGTSCSGVPAPAVCCC